MSEIAVLIVDDEPLARRGIRQLLAPYTDFVIVGECRDGREAVRALAQQRPDLVFLDIRMPGLDGFAVIRAHGPAAMPLTVFVTAHDDFAIQAFEAQALDYLVKPLSEQRFRATIERVRERIRAADAVRLADQLSALLRGRDARPAPAGDPAATAGSHVLRIAVPTATGESWIDSAEIDWIEAEDYYVRIRARAATYRVRDTLRSLEQRLDPARFLRIHRSVIVRLDLVRELSHPAPGGEARVVLRDGTTFPVSRRRLARVRALLRSPRSR